MFKELYEKYHSDKTKFSKFYDFWFSRRKFVNILEIGAYKGGSMRAMKEFYPEANIVGIDDAQVFIDECPDLNIKLGDQRDEVFLKNVIEEMGLPDIIIDDGGHTMTQQIESFKILFPMLKNGGYYIIEDLETSYLKEWIDQRLATTEFLKSFVDDINFHGKSHEAEFGLEDMAKRNVKTNYYEQAIESMHFHNNICLIIKR
jgi:cephalosporin hydroxylase